MTIKTTGVWPVNELGEIVAQAGSGTNTVTGFISQDQIPSDPATNKVPIKINVPAADVLAEPITGFVSGAGTVGATDTILQAFNKIVGNITLKATDLLTGYVSGAGTVAATDTVLQGIQKLNGNVALKALNLLTGFVSGAGAVAATDTVLQGVNKLDGNITANALKASQQLFVIRSADMSIATDQALTKTFAGTKYRITDIIAVRKTGAASVACTGGIYDAATKGGNAVVAATQSWLTLASGVNVAPTKEAVVDTVVLDPTLYLSLTTGSTAACTADIFVQGYIVD